MSITTMSSKGQIVIRKSCGRSSHQGQAKVLVTLAEDRLEVIPLPDDPAATFAARMRKAPP